MCLIHSPDGPRHNYRPFFVLGLAFLLLPGVAWGTHFLWRIAAEAKVTAVPLPTINAHGHSLIFGFLGLFILGFASQAFQRLFGHPLVGTKLLKPVLLAFAGGVLTTMVAQLLGWPWLAAGAAIVEGMAVGTFVVMLALTFRRGGTGMTGWVALVFAGFGFFLVSTLADGALTSAQLACESKYEAIALTSIYQPALRYLEYHGMVMLIILSVAGRMLPGFWTLAVPSARKLYTLTAALSAAVLLEAGLFVGMRLMEDHRLGALLLIPWLTLLAGVLWLVLPWTPWRAFRNVAGITDRTAKFAQASLIWLVVHLVMTIALPFWGMAVGVAFSHAFHGATRQAFVVGCALQMVIAFASRVVPHLNAVPGPMLPRLRGVWALLNLGLILHLTGMAVTDLAPAARWVLPLAGLLQLTAVTLWVLHLGRCFLHGLRPVETPRPADARGLNIVGVG